MKPSSQVENRFDSASLLSKLNFFYVWPFFIQNYKKKVKVSDLESCPKDDTSSKLGEQLENEWNKTVRKGKPGLWIPILRIFGLRFFLWSLIVIINQCGTMIFQTVVMGWLVSDLAQYDALTATSEDRNRIYLYGLYIVLLQAFIIASNHPFVFESMRIGMDIRVATCHMIYKKSLKLSKSALAQTTIGQIVNLLSNDVNRFDRSLQFPQFIVCGPISTIIVTVILYLQPGWSTPAFGNEALPGIAILLLYIPLQAVLGKAFTSLRVKTAILTDERVRIMNEFVKAMKVIKMYAWEVPFSKLVDEKRREEVAMIKKASYLRGLNLGLFFVSTKVILFVILFLYVAKHMTLSSDLVFIALGLINQLRLAVCLYVPYAVSFGAEAFVSLDRIKEFLLLDEVEEWNNPNETSIGNETNKTSIGNEINEPIIRNGKIGDQKVNEQNSLSKEEIIVSFRKVSANYKHNQNQDSKQHSKEHSSHSKDHSGQSSKEHSEQSDRKQDGDNILTDIDFEVKSGELLTIIGTVGSGKSSILMTVLNELPLISGQMVIKGKIAYAGQEAWTVPGTIRDNIVFGSAFNQAKYQEVIQVCSLDRDLELFPDGDRTHVGDTGLSGGQRARVNLARALYADGCNIYLLDDPLSAVDANVASHIFEEAIRKYLREKLVILITHQLQFIKSSDKILLLKNGRNEVYGSYEYLISKGVDFMKINTSVNEQEVAMVVNEMAPNSKHLPPNGDVLIDSIRKIRSDSRHSSSSVRSRKESRFDTVSSSNRKEKVVDMESLEVNEEEKFERVKGAAGKTYWTYFSAGGGIPACLAILLFMGANQFLFTFSDYWLSVWTDWVEHTGNIDTMTMNGNVSSVETGNGMNVSSMETESLVDCFHTKNGMNKYCNATKPGMLSDGIIGNSYIYAAQTFLVFLLAIGRTLVFFIVCMKASIKLHDNLFKCLVRAPMEFFDNNPIGILLNRCSRDIGIIDDILPPTFFDAIGILLVDIASAILICFIDVWIIIPTVVLLILFYYLRKLYIETARSIKKLEGVTRSPVFSHLATSLNGLVTIRAFKCEERFLYQFDSHQDGHTCAWFHFLTSSRWFGLCLDWMCVSYIAAIVISMLSNLDTSNGSSVGLAITSAILLAMGFQWGVRQSTEVETYMTSVERVDEYSHIVSEGELESSGSNVPAPSWPSKGTIEFNNVSLTYFENEGPVLKNLSFKIHEGEKIGIVGRTGAGKSSLINAIFRLTEPDGDGIIIDGIDTRSIGLHDLRKKISIIPQEPVLFSGTIRKNLDPFHQVSDSALWDALTMVQLKDVVQDLPGGLDSVINEEQSPFSVGQRQLVCMARAIIRNNNILILDEATANVDLKTDSLIQETIRKSFSNCTVLTIAHRIDTIIDADRVLVLDAGSVVEFDEPIVLLSRGSEDVAGSFASMCKATGKDMAAKLKMAAQKAADIRHAKMENL